MKEQTKFSERHPFIFILSLTIAAMIIFLVIMAVFQFKIRYLLFQKNKIGIINIQGTISTSRPVIDWINNLIQDTSIKGIILRINSPGGSVAASQEIYQAIKEASHTKPVVVSMGDIAASGGYYIACGATKIVANPGTLTGSIGVIAKFPNIKKLLNKLGIKDETITSGKFKNTGSITKELTEEEKRYIQNLVNDLHTQFVKAVADGRHLPIKKVEAIANGMVYTGKQAKELGLVDMLGGFNTAVKEIKRLCGIKGKVTFVEGPQKKTSIWNLFLGKSTLNLKDLVLTLIFRRIICTPF